MGRDGSRGRRCGGRTSRDGDARRRPPGTPVCPPGSAISCSPVTRYRAACSSATPSTPCASMPNRVRVSTPVNVVRGRISTMLMPLESQGLHFTMDSHRAQGHTREVAARRSGGARPPQDDRRGCWRVHRFAAGERIHRHPAPHRRSRRGASSPPAAGDGDDRWRAMTRSSSSPHTGDRACRAPERIGASQRARANLTTLFMSRPEHTAAARRPA